MEWHANSFLSYRSSLMMIGGWVSSMASKVFSRPTMCNWMSRPTIGNQLNITNLLGILLVKKVSQSSRR